MIWRVSQAAAAVLAVAPLFIAVTAATGGQMSLMPRDPLLPPQLLYAGHELEELEGNGDGRIDYGETVRILVRAHNRGGGATEVAAQLSVDTSQVDLLDPTAEFPEIDPESFAETLFPHFTVRILDTAPASAVSFTVSWTAREGSGQFSFGETISRPDLPWEEMTLRDGGGDSDGALDPGERVSIRIRLRNTGTSAATGVVARLVSTAPDWLRVFDDTIGYEDIPVGLSMEHHGPGLVFEADPETPEGTEILCGLRITADRGFRQDQYFRLTVTRDPIARQQHWPLNTDPGWTRQGSWSFGRPVGSCGDPSAGQAGINAYGYNLFGCYFNYMSPRHLTAGPIDCSEFKHTQLRFLRWLGVEAQPWDRAAVAVSNDGWRWSEVWTNGEWSLQDTSWIAVSYDIAAVADGQSHVFLRWTIGPTDGSVTYGGWNIDEIAVWAERTAAWPRPTVTPFGTAAPETPTPTVTPSLTPTPRPTYPPGTKTPTETPVKPTPPLTPAPSPSPDPLSPTATPTAAGSRTPTPSPTVTETIALTATTAPPPTITPAPPPTATASVPSPTAAGERAAEIDIDLSRRYFRPGDHFVLVFRIDAGTVRQHVTRVLILEIDGQYWFHPAWTHTPGGVNLSLTPGATMTQTLLDFFWPSNAGSLRDIRFWAALLDHTLIELASNVEMESFGYGP